MKKLLFLSVIFAIVAFINSCKEPLGLDKVLITQEPNLYMPISYGSYWIYAVQSTLEGDYIDSVVITGTKEIGGRIATEYSSFRNDTLHQQTYFFTDARKIWMWSRVLEPLVDTSTCGCGYKWENQWRLIANFEGSWQTKDVGKGDIYPVIVYDSTGPNLVEVNYDNILNLNAIKGNFDTINIGNNNLETIQYLFHGEWLFHIDSTKNFSFPKETSGYKDDYNVIIQNLNLDIKFSKNVGIVQSAGSLLYNFNNKLLIKKYTLLRYMINSNSY